MSNLYHIEEWQKYPWLIQGYSLANAGNISYRFGLKEEVDKTREKINQELGLPEVEWSTMQQVHGDRVVASPTTDEADGLITDKLNDILAVQVADCVPLLMVDPMNRRVAAVHAGRRGTFAQIAQQAVNEMVKLGSNVRDIEVAVGPSIGPCCYIFDDEPLDLWSLNEDQLREAGVQTVIRTDFCTKHTNGVFFSHQINPKAGRFAGVVGIKS